MNPEPVRAIVVGVQPQGGSLLVHIARDPRYDPSAAAYPITAVELPAGMLVEAARLLDQMRGYEDPERP